VIEPGGVEAYEAGEEADHGESRAFEDNPESEAGSGDDVVERMDGDAQDVQDITQGPGGMVAQRLRESGREDTGETVETQAGEAEHRNKT
jgi:hypothetical protein